MRIVATTSLPAVDRPNADRWNAARSSISKKQAGAELGKAQLKLELGFTSTSPKIWGIALMIANRY